MAYTYSGYAMVREARRLVQTGALGALRGIQVEYLQDWLADADSDGGWRLDPRTGGAGGCVGISARMPSIWRNSCPACGVKPCRPGSRTL
ncbi:hypothetical protein RAA17_10565 [Komagataeibacter rhaeticus]|nr:hypothetical protein [Komagataeibacter rhaeticus]